MTDNIRIYRLRSVTYDFQESIELTPQEFQQLLERLKVSELSDADTKDKDDEIDALIGDEWEVEWSEAQEERVTDVWRGED